MDYRRNNWRDAYRDDQGSMSLATTGLIIVMLLVLLPMIWNLGAIRTVHRYSQNSSDAAALAGAESVARRLNDLSRDWWGCVPPETPPGIVERYLRSVVVPVGHSGIGQGAAAEYAASNRGALRSYSQRVRWMGADGVHAKLVSGVVVPPIQVDVEAGSPVRGLLARPLYDMEGRPVPTRATAEAYLDQVRTWQTPCRFNPKDAVEVHYQFRWKVRLVKTGR
jgi:hypothetical protein